MQKSNLHSPPVETAVLVYVNADEDMDQVVEDELEGLCEAAQVEPLAAIRQRLEKPHKANFVGTGKADEIAMLTRESHADMVLVDGELSGIQQRNLAETCGVKVIDRTQ